MVVKNTYSVSIDKAGDQELSSRQIQPLELATVADLLQECVHILLCWRCAGRREPLDSLDDAVLADVEERGGENLVGTLINGGDEGSGDKERHSTIRGGSSSGRDAEMMSGGSEYLPD